MGTDITVVLKEYGLENGVVVLDKAGFDGLDIYDIEEYEIKGSALSIWIDGNTGGVLEIILVDFKETTAAEIKALRDNPLPWTFTCESMGIKEKPLEDLLLKIWKRYK